MNFTTKRCGAPVNRRFADQLTDTVLSLTANA